MNINPTEGQTVSATDTLNLQSLNMVRDELVATIEEAARHLELYVTSHHDEKNLQVCIDCIRQVKGTLSLLQLEGAEILAKELLETATDITPGENGRNANERLEIISSIFFVLSRYLEYVQQVERRVPVLLIPHINRLRQIRSEPAYSESHFFDIPLNATLEIAPIDKTNIDDKDLPAHVRRIRCMFQIGLLSLIRGKQVGNSLGMMHRACDRLLKIGGHDQPLSLLWWLARVTLDAMKKENMEFLVARSILFSRIDRIIYQVEQNGQRAFAAKPPAALIKELLYLVLVSGHNNDDIALVKDVYSLPSIPYTDKDLAKERDALRGPSAHTVSSLAKVLQSELANTKKVLESSSQNELAKIDDLDEFLGSLVKVADILGVVGLASAGNALKKEITNIESWRELAEGPDQEQMLEVANTLLYVESTVSALENSTLDDDILNEATELAKRKVIATSELAKAKSIVVEECQSGILLAKRAINSFSESDFDSGHIRNIAKTLYTVRGGLHALGKERAADIMFLCVRFVEEVLFDDDNHPAALKELLETFADAIVTIEFYLDSATASGQMNESVLDSAEENLEALGYKYQTEDDVS